MIIPENDKENGRQRRIRCRLHRIGSLPVAILFLGLTGCHLNQSNVGGREATSPGSFYGLFQMAAPSQPDSPAAPSRTGNKRTDSPSDSSFASEKPGVGDYILYSLVGVPRDLLAMTLDSTGYVSSVTVGLVFNVVMLPFSFIYYGEFKVDRPMSRGCIMVAGFPFFILSDALARSFTGDMNRFRWGVHPFPRTDHRFFPNFRAILDPDSGEDH